MGKAERKEAKIEREATAKASAQAKAKKDAEVRPACCVGVGRGQAPEVSGRGRLPVKGLVTWSVLYKGRERGKL